ncbi:MAG: ribose-phosphate pyrophosphokinase [Eubacteriales bacterium]|nr:ribose-phosphate pyrophosphokinase [Eubacteriales bacterium]
METEKQDWRKDLTNVPIAPLGIIAMAGCEEMGRSINNWLMQWRDVDNHEFFDTEYFTVPGGDRDTFLIKAECPRFGTGESKGMLRESVRGYDIYIICDVTAYDITYRMYNMDVPMSPDDHYSDLKRIIAAIAGKAKRVNVIMPFLYESRQHRRTSRESLDCALALQELESMGVTNILTFDAHDPRVQNAIPLCGFENIMPTYQMLKALCREVKDLRINKESMAVVSPDEGAVPRNIFYSSMLALEMGMFYKRRDYTKVVNGRNPIIAHEYLGPDIAGKDIIVADDILSTGDSIIDLAEELKKRKAARVFAVVTFAFFTSGWENYQEAYDRGLITKVIATDLTHHKEELLKKPWFARANMSKYIAYFIATLNHDHSLNSLLNPYSRIKNLLEHYAQEQLEAGIRLA